VTYSEIHGVAMSKENVIKLVTAGLTASIIGCASSEKVEVVSDWTGRVCESPIYDMIIGTYTGEVSYQQAAQNRSCRWNTTVTITGTNAGSECALSGGVNNELLEQSTQFEASAYSCDFGNRESSFAFGLGAGDDLNSIRPVSVIAYFEPGLEETDINGQELIYAVTQSRSLDIERDGRSGASVIQLDANILTKQ